MAKNPICENSTVTAVPVLLPANGIQQRHQMCGAGKMQKIAAPVAFPHKAADFALALDPPMDVPLKKHPPEERIEPGIDPMLKRMPLNLIRQRAHFVIGTAIVIGAIDVLQNLAMVLWRENEDARLDDVRLA